MATRLILINDLTTGKDYLSEFSDEERATAFDTQEREILSRGNTLHRDGRLYLDLLAFVAVNRPLHALRPAPTERLTA